MAQARLKREQDAAPLQVSILSLLRNFKRLAILKPPLGQSPREGAGWQGVASGDLSTLCLINPGGCPERDRMTARPLPTNDCALPAALPDWRTGGGEGRMCSSVMVSLGNQGGR